MTTPVDSVMVLQLQVTINDIEPPIWRRFWVEDTITEPELVQSKPTTSLLSLLPHFQQLPWPGGRSSHELQIDHYEADGLPA